MSTHHLERAAALDAAGNHEAAINELALGTRAGDVHCTRMLGLRLFLGDRAPLLPDEGLQFIGDVVARGNGEPAARIAGLLALGVNRPANMESALHWLCRSATAGWDPAQRQLLALCDDRGLARQAAGAKAPDWRQVASSVELASWRRAPAADVLHDDPRISSFADLVRPEICAFLISQAEGRLEPARVYDPVAREDIVIPNRSNTLATFDMHNIELLNCLVQSRMSVACGISERHMESPMVLHYAPGEQIAEHYDFVAPETSPDYSGEIARNGQRVITFLIYLNDDYLGGETAFPELGVIRKGRTGEGLYFVNALADLTPDKRMVHAGRPTTRGEKWLVTQFVRSRPMR